MRRLPATLCSRPLRFLAVQAQTSRESQAKGPQRAFEVPLMSSTGTSIAQFQIARDGRAVTADGRAVWRARFSVDMEPMGPVHAQVTLLSNRAAVTLWAERPHTAAQLQDGSPRWLTP